MEFLKQSRVRVIARTGDCVLKVFLKRSRGPRLESRALRRAAERGIPVPELVAHGPYWVATRRLEGRPATRDDLAALLPLIERAHDAGLLHGDLHVGNLWMTPSGDAILLDLQKAHFFAWLPGPVRRRELGAFAYSLGDPLPEALGHVATWCRRRAHVHWRSRTKRCLVESSGFSTFEADGHSGFRHRNADPALLREALANMDRAELIWPARAGSHVYRSGDLILKRHASERLARSAWRNGHGLEVRGIRTGLALAWAGPWLWMEDAGESVVDWGDKNFEAAPEPVREEMMQALVDVLVRLHDRGIYHADLKTWNFTWSPSEPARVLDYERVTFGKSVSRRRRIKNLAQVNAELPLCVGSELRERAWLRYVEELGVGDSLEPLQREVAEQSRARISG